MNSSGDTKKLIYLGITAIVVIIGGILLGVSGAFSQASSMAPLAFEQTSHAFGQISMKDGKVSKIFTVKNTGTEAAKFTDIRTSCMCTEAVIDGKAFGMHGPYGANIKIEPGGKQEIEVIFDPNAHGPSGTGPITRDIYIETNSSETPELSLRITGNVIR